MLALALIACQTLLSDLETTPTPKSSRPIGYVEFEERTLFLAERPGAQQLWSSDGSVGGTQLIFEWATLFSITGPPQFSPLGDGLVFWVEPGEVELWFTDGTASGTRRLWNESQSSSNFLGLAVDGPFPQELHQGELYFAIDKELWATNGTERGTRLVESYPLEFPRDLVSRGDELFFLADGIPGLVAFAAWSEADQSTRLVRFFPDTAIQEPTGLTRFGDRLLFAAADFPPFGTTHDNELWVSDGSAEGTQEIADLNLDSSSYPAEFTEVDGWVYFTATPTLNGPRQLWRTDATASGTELVLEADVVQVAALDGAVAYLARTGGTFEVGFTDGTAPTPDPVLLALSGKAVLEPDRLLAREGRAYFETPLGFNQTTSSTRALWVSDFTPGGTAVLAETEFPFEAPGQVGSQAKLPFRSAWSDDRLWFSNWSVDGGREPWTSLGSVGTTQILADFQPGVLTLDSSPRQLARIGERIFFQAILDGDYESLTIGPGDASFLDLVVSSNQSSFTVPTGVELGAYHYFCTPDQKELWRTGGNLATTSRIVDYDVPTQTFDPRIAQFEAGQDRFFMVVLDPEPSTHNEVWVSDGTAAGTVELFDRSGSIPIVSDGSRIFFSGLQLQPSSLGFEPWISDGTPEGTQLLADIVPGFTASDPGQFHIWRGDTYFFTRNEQSDRSLVWKVAAGSTTPVVAIDLGLDFPAGVARLESTDDELLVFSRSDASAGLLDETQLDLWTSQGDTASTTLLQGFPGFVWDGNKVFAVSDEDRVYFAAPNASDGGTLWLWQTLGSAGASEPLAALPDVKLAVSGIEQLENFVTVPSSPRLFFSVYGNDTGQELWTTDGTAQGTQGVTESLNPGLFGTDPGPGVRVGDRYFFSGRHPHAGREVLFVTLSDLGDSVVEAAGAGCPGSSGLAPSIGFDGPARIGANVSVTVSGAASASPGFLALSGSLAPIDFDGCALWIGLPWSLFPAATGPSGSAGLAFQVPAEPTLLGTSTYFQWAIADPGGALLDSFSVSDRLEVTLGQ